LSNLILFTNYNEHKNLILLLNPQLYPSLIIKQKSLINQSTLYTQLIHKIIIIVNKTNQHNYVIKFYITSKVNTNYNFFYFIASNNNKKKTLNFVQLYFIPKKILKTNLNALCAHHKLEIKIILLLIIFSYKTQYKKKIQNKNA